MLCVFVKIFAVLQLHACWAILHIQKAEISEPFPSQSRDLGMHGKAWANVRSAVRFKKNQAIRSKEKKLVSEQS